MKFKENWPSGFREDDGQQVITIAHPEPLAQLKKKKVRT